MGLGRIDLSLFLIHLLLIFIIVITNCDIMNHEKYISGHSYGQIYISQVCLVFIHSSENSAES